MLVQFSLAYKACNNVAGLSINGAHLTTIEIGPKLITTYFTDLICTAEVVQFMPRSVMLLAADQGMHRTGFLSECRNSSDVSPTILDLRHDQM